MDAGGTLPDIFVAGVIQSKKMIKSNSVKKAYIASDADLKEVSSIQSLCESHEIEIDSTLTMKDIGKLCGVESDCAVCVALI